MPWEVVGFLLVLFQRSWTLQKAVPGYVGCFLDSGTPPTLSGSSGTSTKLTVQVCLSFCRKRGYKFAGVEAGYACFCGHEGDIQHSQQVSAVECDQVCFGKSSELCGGDGRIGISTSWFSPAYHMPMCRKHLHTTASLTPTDWLQEKQVFYTPGKSQP